MELKEGMLIRTKEGIRQIIDIYEDEDGKYYELNRDLHYRYPEGHGLYEEDLQDEEDPIEIKASFNIIDVIEEGDYVNGEMVMEADWSNDNDEYEEGLAFPLYDGEDKDVIVNWQPLKYTKIKSIVTHEQFDAMKYEVK